MFALGEVGVVPSRSVSPCHLFCALRYGAMTVGRFSKRRKSDFSRPFAMEKRSDNYASKLLLKDILVLLLRQRGIFILQIGNILIFSNHARSVTDQMLFAWADLQLLCSTTADI